MRPRATAAAPQRAARCPRRRQAGPARSRPGRARVPPPPAPARRPGPLARPAPGRTRAGPARPPNSRPRPETTIVLPAPVSPVTTLKPGDSSSTASSITPRPVIRTSSSIAARLLVSLTRCRGSLAHDNIVVLRAPSVTPAPPACHGKAALRDKPVGKRRADLGSVGARADASHPGEQPRLPPPPHPAPPPRTHLHPTASVAPQNGPRRLTLAP